MAWQGATRWLRLAAANCPTFVEEFYCAIGIVANIPPFADRPSMGSMAWAGQEGAAAAPSPSASPSASPPHKKSKLEQAVG